MNLGVDRFSGERRTERRTRWWSDIRNLEDENDDEHENEFSTSEFSLNQSDAAPDRV